MPKVFSGVISCTIGAKLSLMDTRVYCLITASGAPLEELKHYMKNQDQPIL
jgi:hypothetical protein